MSSLHNFTIFVNIPGKSSLDSYHIVYARKLWNTRETGRWVIKTPQQNLISIWMTPENVKNLHRMLITSSVLLCHKTTEAKAREMEIFFDSLFHAINSPKLRGWERWCFFSICCCVCSGMLGKESVWPWKYFFYPQPSFSFFPLPPLGIKIGYILSQRYY